MSQDLLIVAACIGIRLPWFRQMEKMLDPQLELSRGLSCKHWTCGRPKEVEGPGVKGETELCRWRSSTGIQRPRGLR